MTTAQSNNVEATVSHFSVNCPSRAVFEQLADKWSMMIMSILKAGPARFNHLKRCLEGVSQKSLSTTLKRLERNGIIARIVLGTKPPSVTYELTPLGRSLLPPLGAIHVWAYENMSKVEEARRIYDEAQT
jgi:DNA-binding HxlR family transcriptional regulator